MKLGFGLITCQRHPADTRSDVELYQQAIELAVEAEELGFDSVWVSEHHFLDDAYMPSLLPVLAALAARTRSIRLGTALLLAPLYDPLRLAEDAATVDLLSGGRLTLGLGLGWREEEFDALGVAMSERAARLEGTVEVLRRAWDGDLVEGAMGPFSYDAVAVRPRPAQDGGPPLWIGAMAERAVRRAGRIADGFMATEVTPASFATQIAWLRQAAEAAGRDPGALSLSLHLPTFAWPGSDAWQRVSPHHHYVDWKYVDMEEARRRGGAPSGPPPLSAADEARLREGILVGRPEDVAEQIDRFRAVGGDDLEYIARLYWPGMDLAVQRETLHVFAERVAPLLRG